MIVRGRRAAVPAAILLLAAGCTSMPPPTQPGDDPKADPKTAPSALDPGEPRLDMALSEPREDSLYPDVGDPGIDALHYDLDLAWDRDARRLEATETLRLRATRNASTLRLDLGEPLEVGTVQLDGAEVAFRHEGKDLLVDAAVREDVRYALRLTYAGAPQPVEAPSARSDVITTGWHTTRDGQTWTMQEPFGAYTWYAVNDHPSDKALYDITVTVRSPFVGVANGKLVERTESDGSTSTTWHLAQPAAPYLVTVATGPFTRDRDSAAGATPISYWSGPGFSPRRLQALRVAPRALRWLERRLGPYPFDTLGFVVVDSRSAMETQTMITLGDTAYSTSEAVVVHELAHHWYGNQVTPDDWRDLWMSEGMATYLQLVWESEQGGVRLAQVMAEIAAADQGFRRYAGPPAGYDTEKFAESNVYYPPALMWHRLRQRIGEQRFWAVVRAWPAARDDQSTGRDDYWQWLSEQTGEDLSGFFEAWLLAERSPARRERDPAPASR